MKISDYAVKNYQFTLVIFLMIVALGITTIFNMPRSEDPEIHAPQFPIVVVYAGTSPKDMEELVVEPIERKVSSLEGIKSIETNIGDGVAVVFVEYKYESVLEEKYQELVREVNSLRDELPRDLTSIEVRKVMPSDVNVVQIALVSENATREALRKNAERLQDELEKIKTLKKVDIHGLSDPIIRIDLQLERMAAQRIPLEAVVGTVQSEIANIPGGSVDAGNKSFNIKTSGNYEDLQEIKNTIVYSANGRNVTLENIAEVYMDYSEEKHITRLNGHRCVFVVAAQKPGENISKTSEAYRPVIEKFKSTLPSNIDLIHHFDQADNVNRRLGGLGTDFLIAILLVAVTLLPLGQRAALIVMISIPLSLAVGITLMNALGYNLNQLSIVGLVVALGLLVDDSIVVVENIERWMREGHTRMEATLRGTQQIGMAVLGCTVTLIISFMPLVFLPEAAGEFIRSLPMGVITCVLASLLVSLTIIPFLSSRLLKEHVGHPDGNIFLRSLKKIIQRSYAPLLERALNRPYVTLAVALVIFVGSLQLFPVVGFSLFPSSEKPQFLVEITTPLQSNLTYTDSITRKIEQELKNHQEVAYFATNVGKGNPRIYYNVIPENERTDFAQIFVQLDDNTPPHKKLSFIEDLRKKWTPYPGAKVEVKNFEQGPPIVAPVEVRLYGENLDTLRSLASRVEHLLEQTEGTIYIKNPVNHLKSDIRLSINKEKARMLGIPTVSIDRTVRLAVAGLNVGEFSDEEGQDYDIIITKAKQEHPTLDVLDNLYVNNAMGQAIPLKQVAQLKLESSPVKINHRDKSRVVSVNAFIRKGYLSDNVTKDVIAQMNQMKLPEGYAYEMGGELESRNESFGGFAKVIIITVFLFIAVLILEFGTFKSTLIVLSVIPLGVVGAVLALLFTGNSLSFVAIVGMIALAGIEVKNTILLVDFTNQLREQGKPLDVAIREAGEVRFLPIILTSLTAIGGLMPIAISTNPLISPLAIVLIGGLISSTLLSRVVTPVVYKLIPPRIGARVN
ncbi:MAG TPA: efflux RND transporter permease subunit [Cyclobacteriaceae bacterium]|nr:efflux RND transporter permease subunit [Cyclobacteriaceae bacterium]